MTVAIPPRDIPELRDFAPEHQAPETWLGKPERNGQHEPLAGAPRLAVDGATFILDAPATVASLWGDADRVGWARGEALMICGPSGAGKTTFTQQLALARIGVLEPELLGLSVDVDGDRSLLYIAGDRPEQARRSFARMVTDSNRHELEQRLTVWKGPPPFDVLKEPQSMSIFAQEHGAGTVVIDSLKDIVPDLSKDEVGSRYNIARQHVLAVGIELIEIHHQRKNRSDGGKPKRLDDVYGSTWITAGAGSVFVLWGEAGDSVVELIHLKQPLEEIGPHKVHHDHHTGRTTLDAPVDLTDLVRGAQRGITARSTAIALFDKKDPNRNDIEKARRRLDALVRTGTAYKQPGAKGGSNGGESDLWFTVPDPVEMSA